MKKIAIALFLFIVLAHSAEAQKSYPTPIVPKNDDNSRLGLFAHYNFNFHNADFTSLHGVASCCPKFNDGSGTGFSLGLLYELPVYKDLFLSARAGYFVRDGKLTAKETETVYDYLRDLNVEGVFEHSLDAKLSVLAVEPTVNYRFFDNFFMHGGFQLGFANLSKKYEHSERILSPAAIYYENNLRERFHSTGDLEKLSGIQFSLLFGLSYEIFLNKSRTFILAPEAFYTYGLTNVVKDVDWKIHSLRLGFSLKYSFSSTKMTEALAGLIEAVSVNPDGEESPVVQIQVEEFLSSNIKPLLTYVFFENNSSDIPDRYVKLTADAVHNFTEDGLYNLDAIETYYNMLNVIGKRMTQYPDAKIAIDGCNSGAGKEKNNLKLSRDRARAVRDYFLNVWKIPPHRMIVDKRNLPQEPSNVRELDGVVENRRVEITSNKWEIIAPVTSKDTFRTVTPPAIRFKNEYSGGLSPAEWSVTASQNDNVLKSFYGAGGPPETLEWQIDIRQKNIPQTSGVLDYQLNLVDKGGNAFATPVESLPVEQITIQKKKREKIKDKYIDRFSLILFSFDEANLSFYNNKVVQMVQSAAKPNSVVKIKGHTDRMGNEAHNMTLSKKRAKLIADKMKAKEVIFDGRGEKDLVYDNTLPEGRFYCRRVDIIVETPIE